MKPIIKQALTTALTAVSCLYIAECCHLPQPFWAVMSSIVVMQADPNGTINASWMRIAGTFAGALSGGVFLGLWGSNAITLGIGVGLVVVICALLRLIESYRIAAVTVAVVVLTGHQGSPWETAIWRFLEVSFGIVFSVLVTALLHPSVIAAKFKK